MEQKNIQGKLIEDLEIKPFTWLRVGGKAKFFFLPKDKNDLVYFLRNFPHKDNIFILGAGSNIIFRDGGFDGVVIKLGPSFSSIQIKDDKVIIGGAALDRQIAQITSENNLAGLQFLTGVPGTLGGAIKMNSGCYGSEVKDLVTKVETVTSMGEIKIYQKNDLDFSYRSSNIPDNEIIVSAEFQCKEDKKENLLDMLKSINEKRNNSQPIKEKTSGSTFKNPDLNLSNGKKAWQLIDEAGGRGYKYGGAMMSNMHCNFLINFNNATAFEIEKCGEDVKKMVEDKFSISLKWEVKKIGNFM